MKVVLTENVKGIGKKLDVVNVSEGYARNYLIPRKLAKPADNQSLSEANTKKEAIKYKQDTERDLAAKKKEQIEQTILEFKLKTAEGGKLFGSVTSKEISDELKGILQEIEYINYENDRLSKLYDGHFAFVKTLQDFVNVYPDLNKKDIEQLSNIIFNSIKGIVDNKDNLLVQGRDGFVAETKRKTMPHCAKAKAVSGQGLYKELQLKNTFDYLLSQLYTNLLLY